MKRKITIKNLNDKIDIIVDNIKFVCGNDFESRDKIKKVLINKFNKVAQSDYAKENYESDVLFDDEPISVNDFTFYNVDANYDLIQDVKLGTKSLALDYLNALFENIEYSEEYQTINNLLISLIDDRLEETSFNVKTNLDCLLTKKLLIKLLEVNFTYDDLTINNYDLSLENRLLLQLNMIKQISLKTKKQILLLIECPVASKIIVDTLKDINAISIVMFDKIIDGSYDDILVLDKIRIDISNEEALYELCLNNKTTYYSIKEMKSKVIDDYLNPRII